MSSLDDERTDAEVARRINAAPFITYKEECEALREQVEKLTEAYDQCGRTVQDYGRSINQTETRLHEVATHCANVEQQLAALAEQNEKMREALASLEEAARCVQAGEWDRQSINPERMVAKEALSLPDLATPLLNKYRADGMRMAAEICHVHSEGWRKNPGANPMAGHIAADNCEYDIRARAAELGKAS